jgi:hypothetical protein
LLRGRAGDEGYFMEEILQQVLNSLRDQELLNKVALDARFKIVNRTRKGISVEGTSFGQYSEAYAKKRTKAGLPISPVTLTFDDVSGMLQQITHETSSDLKSVSVYIQKPEKELIMTYLSQLVAGRNRKLFHFWDLNQDEENDLAAIIGDELEKKFTLIKGTTL